MCVCLCVVNVRVVGSYGCRIMLEGETENAFVCAMRQLGAEFTILCSGLVLSIFSSFVERNAAVVWMVTVYCTSIVQKIDEFVTQMLIVHTN